MPPLSSGGTFISAKLKMQKEKQRSVKLKAQSLKDPTTNDLSLFLAFSFAFYAS
jgi:hypothetical protein